MIALIIKLARASGGRQDVGRIAVDG